MPEQAEKFRGAPWPPVWNSCCTDLFYGRLLFSDMQLVEEVNLSTSSLSCPQASYWSTSQLARLVVGHSCF